MTIQTAVQQLLEVEAKRGEGAYNQDSLCVGLSRLGADDQQIVAGSMQQLLEVDFGAPLHCLVLAGESVGGCTALSSSDLAVASSIRRCSGSLQCNMARGIIAVMKHAKQAAWQ
jgi:diphthine synthase